MQWWSVHRELGTVMLSYWGKILNEKPELKQHRTPVLNFTWNKCYKLKTLVEEWAVYVHRLSFVCKPETACLHGQLWAIDSNSQF